MNGVALRLATVCAVGVLSIIASPARAQNKIKRPFDDFAKRPTVSPYMNLVNNPQGGATNYQSLVRPQIEQGNYNRRQTGAINQLQRQAASTRSQSSSQGNQQLRGTGHRTMFNATSRYFPSAKQ